MAYLLEWVGEVRAGGILLDLGLIRGVAHNRVDHGRFVRVRICDRRGRKGRRGSRATLLLHVTEHQGKVLVSRLLFGRVSMPAPAVQSNKQTRKRTCIADAADGALEAEAPLEQAEAPAPFIFARILSILEVDS